MGVLPNAKDYAGNAEPQLFELGTVSMTDYEAQEATILVAQL
jgi:hypothetical protein